ncbi:Hypothetical protein PHPALM_338 [Phytophthora palmivora]|uniref:Uncharacterized protein n=1 Tax=Phytophthora palmivora TaxID=4796 RepID=A0A2P4YV45_9STRA|nr:Hypothetical protein PHPALM_338 [Phytophthora palmivora]
MSKTKSDVDARVLDYFHLCNTIVKNNGLAVLFSEEDGAKKKCKRIDLVLFALVVTGHSLNNLGFFT